jgi:hypothetical protein
MNGLTGDKQHQLREKCKNFVTCSVAVDVSTDIAQLAFLFKVLVRTSVSGGDCVTGTDGRRNRY